MLRFIGILLPTLVLLSSFSWRRVYLLPVYSESFANKENYLTLDFERPVKMAPNRFKGYWTTDSRERKVFGEKRSMHRSIQYVMELPEGRFVGSLGHSKKGCEPVMRYTVEKRGVVIQHGSLRGAFCL